MYWTQWSNAEIMSMYGIEEREGKERDIEEIEEYVKELHREMAEEHCKLNMNTLGLSEGDFR